MRSSNLNTFFRHKPDGKPYSLSSNGKLCHGSKSDILNVIQNMVRTTDTRPLASNLVIDRPALVQMIRPTSTIKTFEEYINKSLCHYILNKAKFYDRIDIVFDVYLQNSLKAGVRENRGKGFQLKVVGDAPIPKNWQNFLCDTSNKTKLFNLVAESLQSLNPFTVQLYLTK